MQDAPLLWIEAIGAEVVALNSACEAAGMGLMEKQKAIQRSKSDEWLFAAQLR
jgi:hypothetical protein